MEPATSYGIVLFLSLRGIGRLFAFLRRLPRPEDGHDRAACREAEWNRGRPATPAAPEPRFRRVSGGSPRVWVALLLCALCLLAFPAPVTASPAVFTLGGDTSQVYGGENVGPYLGVLTGSPVGLFFCLDLTLTAYFGQSYAGSAAPPSSRQEEEAAFLAAYTLQLGAPSSSPSIVNAVEGPVTFAIWQIMGTMGGIPEDPNAQPFVQLAENAYDSGLITTSFLSQVSVFTPDDPGVQRFIGVDSADLLALDTSVPEPGAATLLVLGLLSIAAGYAWRRRRRRAWPHARPGPRPCV